MAQCLSSLVLVPSTRCIVACSSIRVCDRVVSIWHPANGDQECHHACSVMYDAIRNTNIHRVHKSYVNQTSIITLA